jgi:Epoxide hydrolase N terminus
MRVGGPSCLLEQYQWHHRHGNQRPAGAPCHNLGVAATALHAEPVRVVLDRVALEDLSRRLRATRLAPDADGTWARGTPGDWLTELVADWQAFDPLDLQARLDRLTHLRVEVDGIAVHLVHAPATAAGSVPLLLTLKPIDGYPGQR